MQTFECSLCNKIITRAQWKINLTPVVLLKNTSEKHTAVFAILVPFYNQTHYRKQSQKTTPLQEHNNPLLKMLWPAASPQTKAGFSTLMQLQHENQELHMRACATCVLWQVSLNKWLQFSICNNTKKHEPSIHTSQDQSPNTLIYVVCVLTRNAGLE